MTEVVPPFVIPSRDYNLLQFNHKLNLDLMFFTPQNPSITWWFRVYRFTLETKKINSVKYLTLKPCWT